MSTPYTLTASELKAVHKKIIALDKMSAANVTDDAVLVLPDRIPVRDTDYLLIGYVVAVEDYWAFESITEEERDKDSKLEENP